MSWTSSRLDVWLVTADLAAAVGFWRDVVGLDVVQEAAGRATLACGAQRIRLVAPHPAPPRRPGGLYAGTGYRVLALVVDGLDALCDRIVARGRRVAEGVDLPGQWPIRFARDADGNMLELIGRPECAAPDPRDPLQVGLNVADSELMRRFYGGCLSLPEDPATPMGEGMTRFAFGAGTSTLKLWSRSEALPRLAGPPLEATGIRAIRLVVDDLDGALAALADRGVRARPVPAIETRGRSAWIEDPEGGSIELSEAG